MNYIQTNNVKLRYLFNNQLKNQLKLNLKCILIVQYN